MTPNSPMLPWENRAAPFQGGLSETASVWVSLQALSAQDAKDFTHSLYPSTCKGSFPFFMAEANSLIVWLKLMDGADVVAVPRAFLSAKTMTMLEVSRSSKSVSFSEYASQSITSVFHFKALAMADPTPSANRFRASASGSGSLDRLSRFIRFLNFLIIILVIFIAFLVRVSLPSLKHFEIWLATPHVLSMFHIP